MCRFAEAYYTDDVDGVVAVLTDDAWLATSPAPHEYHGARSDRRLPACEARAGATAITSGSCSTSANTQPAQPAYLGDPNDPTSQPSGIVVISLSGDRIGAITRSLDPKLPSIFGFGRTPDELRSSPTKSSR